MSLPRRLILNGKTWRVRVVRGLKEREGCVGSCDREKLTLFVDASLAPDEKLSTLTHEVLHAVWPRGIVGDDEEERLVNALEAPIHGAFVVRR